MNSRKKQFFAVFIIFTIILLVYYLQWLSSMNKIINSIEENSTTIMQYSEIKKSGFPFFKKITINSVDLKSNKNFFDNSKTSFDSIILSGIMFGDKFKVTLNNGKYFIINDDMENYIEFNENPKIEVAFYSHGYIKSISYSDNGYKIMSKTKKTISTSGSNIINLKSVKEKNVIDYIIDISMKSIQNFSIFRFIPKVSKTFIPDSYNLNLKSSLSLSINNSDVYYMINIDEGIIKNTTKNFQIKFDGKCQNSKNDKNIFGLIIISIDKVSIVKNLIKDTLYNAIKKDINLTARDKSLSENYLNNFFNSIEQIAINKGNFKQFTINRIEGGSFYTINKKKINDLLN